MEILLNFSTANTALYCVMVQYCKHGSTKQGTSQCQEEVKSSYIRIISIYLSCLFVFEGMSYPPSLIDVEEKVEEKGKVKSMLRYQ